MYAVLKYIMILLFYNLQILGFYRLYS